MRITFGGPRCYWTTLASDLRAWRKWRCRRGNGSSSVTSSSVNPEKNSVPSRSNYGDMCHFREFKIQLLSSELASTKQACSAGGGSPNSRAKRSEESQLSFILQVICSWDWQCKFYEEAIGGGHEVVKGHLHPLVLRH